MIDNENLSDDLVKRLRLNQAMTRDLIPENPDVANALGEAADLIEGLLTGKCVDRDELVRVWRALNGLSYLHRVRVLGVSCLMFRARLTLEQLHAAAQGAK